MFVIAAAPVMPVVLLVRLADTVPLVTLNPLPTITAPAAETVANGNLAAASVPVDMLLAFVASVVALAARPDTAVDAMAMAVELAAVRRPAESTVIAETDDAEP
jgi:hypothetical protein